jgi:hypothetical protein
MYIEYLTLIKNKHYRIIYVITKIIYLFIFNLYILLQQAIITFCKITFTNEYFSLNKSQELEPYINYSIIKLKIILFDNINLRELKIT